MTYRGSPPPRSARRTGWCGRSGPPRRTTRRRPRPHTGRSATAWSANVRRGRSWSCGSGSTSGRAAAPPWVDRARAPPASGLPLGPPHCRSVGLWSLTRTARIRRMVTPVDPTALGFLLAENRRMPMHVGGLQLYRKPPDAGRNYVRDLFESMRDTQEIAPLFLKHPHRSIKTGGQWVWVEDDQFDIEHHVR